MDNIVTEEDNPRGCMKSCWHYIQRIKLLVSSLAAVVLGIGLGLILKFYVPVSEYEQVYMSIPGGMLLRLLQVTSVPLVVTTLMTGVCSLTVETSRKVVVRAAAYVIATTLLSVATGLVLVLSIKPGVAHAASKEDAGGEAFSTIDALLDLVRNIVPTNLILASLLHQKTGRMEVEFEADEQPSSLETNATQVRLSGNIVQGTNILGLIVWSYVFGLVLNKMGEDGKVIVKFLTGLNDCLKYLVNLILGSLPVGMLFMMTSLVLEVPDWETVFKVGNFMAVVLLGLVIHGTCVLPLIYFLCTRRDPRVDIKVFLPALKAAFLNSSSSATLPLTLHCCEEINKGISRFMLPIGSNINGTALFEVVTAVFIAQFNHIHLEIGQLMTITVTSVLLSIGAAGIPSTGAMTTFFVLTAAGLPAKEASFLVVIEWLLDRCNTVINVMGDCIGVALVHQVLINDQEDTGARTGNGKTSDDHVVLCLARMHGRVAETRAPDDIKVHISPSAQDEDSDPEILCTAPEYPPDKDMYD